MVNVASIWHATLERLDTVPVDAVCRTWLEASSFTQIPPPPDDPAGEADAGLAFLLVVPHKLARDVVSARWQGMIEDILADLSGQSVLLQVTSATELNNAEIEVDREATSGHEATRGNYAYYEVATTRRADNQPEVREQYPIYPAPPSLADALTEDWDNEQRANILMHNRLNPRYTFDAFIVGNSNRLAHAASLAVAEAPGESYNPLFLYGGVGLGKTHLLHAIGHQGVQTGLAVLYVSSEQFTNEIVNAIRYRTTEEFRAKYRSVDILLVDDIQFIAGKESTEEEFFHTFNSLYELSKQIVICSDRPPKAIVSLEERLRSRFEWGLIADIQPPDLETRMAILRVKADLLHYRVPDEIIAYIAGRVQTNIRELEGCLNRLMAYQQLHHTELTMEVARAAMSSLGEDTREPRLNSRQIAESVAEFYHISLEAMCGKQRDKHIVMPRQIAMYLIRQETEASLLEIGQLFGGRDHSTVLHACEKIDRAVNINPVLRREIVAIREQLLRE
jgi:chromosomal replication initiator protein